MSWVYEIALRAAPETQMALNGWFASGPRSAMAELPGLTCADCYTPAEGSALDPYNHDTSGPLMLLMLDFRSLQNLAEAMKKRLIARSLDTLPDVVGATGAAFERRFYPVGTEMMPAPLDAPFSYVVRYHRPAQDEAAFIANYLATHPVTLAGLPGIRAIMCYLPIAGLEEGDLARLASPDYMIGNEVAFDDLAAFNVAMDLPVRQELRAHFREFPPFSGANTHYPMMRQRFAG